MHTWKGAWTANTHEIMVGLGLQPAARDPEPRPAPVPERTAVTLTSRPSKAPPVATRRTEPPRVAGVPDFPPPAPRQAPMVAPEPPADLRVARAEPAPRRGRARALPDAPPVVEAVVAPPAQIEDDTFEAPEPVPAPAPAPARVRQPRRSTAAVGPERV